MFPHLHFVKIEFLLKSRIHSQPSFPALELGSNVLLLGIWRHQCSGHFDGVTESMGSRSPVSVIESAAPYRNLPRSRA
jgi:hypothetical protein